MSEASLSADRVRALLSYDAATGEFRWRAKRRRVRVGALAGSFSCGGYWNIRVDGRLHMAHRLAWLYTHGAWPQNQIDHVDGDRLNNSLVNLREATGAQNIRNRGPHRNNEAGLKGVSPVRRSGKWRALIRIAGKVVYLGEFASPGEAHSAYAVAARAHHGEFFKV